MAAELRDTLVRLQRKSEVLIEKYQALLAQNQLLNQQLEQAERANEKLRAQVERLEQDNKFMRMAHAIAPSQQVAEQARATLSKIVRDIDRCISQLNT